MNILYGHYEIRMTKTALTISFSQSCSGNLLKWIRTKKKKNSLLWINPGPMPDISLDLMNSASLRKPSWKKSLQDVKPTLNIAFQAKV